MTRTELVNAVKDCYLVTPSYNLYSCSAHYNYTNIHGDVCIVLTSYWTRVAVYNTRTGVFYKFGYYSATTSQHCSKFAKLLHELRYDFVKTVNLYADSRTSKKQARADEECDYATSIDW